MFEVSNKLTRDDVAYVLNISSEGWNHYVKYEWPPLHNLPLALEITRKFSGQHVFYHHRCIEK